MKTIIAPTDFSDVSYNAALYAAKLAEDAQARLILLHVVELPITVTEFPVTEAVYDEISMEEELKRLKHDLMKETRGKIKIHTTNIVGSVECELKELCNIEKPFAVVMGTHSYSVVERFFKGSTTVYSAKHLNYPVLVVPAGISYKPIKKIALASDLKNIYSIPLNEIQNILTAFNASLQVFHVNKQGGFEKDSVESLLLSHRLLNLKPEFFTIENEDVERGVEILAEKNETDLILIIPKKHGPFHKAQSNAFILYSPVPVMAIHEENFVHQPEEKTYSKH